MTKNHCSKIETFGMDERKQSAYNKVSYVIGHQRLYKTAYTHDLTLKIFLYLESIKTSTADEKTGGFINYWKSM